MTRPTHEHELQKLRQDLDLFRGTLLKARSEITAHEFEGSYPAPTDLGSYLSHLIDTISLLETNVSEQLEEMNGKAAA